MTGNEQPTGMVFVMPPDYGGIRIYGSGNVMPPGYKPPEPKPEPKVIDADPLVLEGEMVLITDYEEQGIEIDGADIQDAIQKHFTDGDGSYRNNLDTYRNEWNLRRRFRITVELLPEEGGAE